VLQVVLTANKVLGWIKPDDGVRLPLTVAPYECFGLDAWLRARGVAGVQVVIETSTANNGHGLADLIGTGDPERLLAPAHRLAAQGVQALCWACTSGSFAGGVDWAKKQLERIADETGLPTTSAAFALVEAVRALGADTVDLLSPYPAGLTDTFCDFLAHGGVRVRAASALGCHTGSDSHGLDVRRAIARFPSAGRRDGIPLLIPDSAVNTLDLVADLEAELERPVVTANQATLWKGLSLLSMPPRVPGLGRLLAPGDR
jgi:maleate isomerase